MQFLKIDNSRNRQKFIVKLFNRKKNAQCEIFLLTFSEFSKSNLNAQSFSLAGNSEMEVKVRRNCSADPKGRSGLAACASCILDFSSLVGSIVKSFYREDFAAGREWTKKKSQLKIRKIIKNSKLKIYRSASQLNREVDHKHKLINLQSTLSVIN